MRGVARIIFSALLVVGLIAGVYGGVVAFQWLQSQGVLEAAFDRRPQEPVAFASLNRYTREAAGKAWFVAISPPWSTGRIEAPQAWSRSGNGRGW